MIKLSLLIELIKISNGLLVIFFVCLSNFRDMHWKTITATGSQSKEFWHFFRLFSCFFFRSWNLLKLIHCIGLYLHLHGTTLRLNFAHPVKRKNALFRSERDQLHFTELIARMIFHGLIVGRGKNVTGDVRHILVHGHNTLHVILIWSKTNITNTENIFQSNFFSWFVFGGQRVDVGHLMELVYENSTISFA